MLVEHTEKGPLAMKNTFKITMNKDSTHIYISSMFDSGNIEKVQIGPNNSILVSPANDCAGTKNESHAKGWFYFSVSGASLHMKLKIIVKKMSQLSSQTKQSQYFRPVYRYENQEWNRCQYSRTITKQDDTQLHIDFEITKLHKVYFAYTYPFSYEENEKFLHRLGVEAKKNKSIHYHDQVLIFSCDRRKIHLVTITGADQKNDDEEIIDDHYLFPEKEIKTFQRVSAQKRVVILSARVHPSETPSSHTFNGFIKFLLSKDARAHYLRRNFVFKMVPMLNPDGVSSGHHRMDLHGQNLNRFYQNPDPLLQPSAYAMKQLGRYYSEQKKLCFYIDLHAHPQRKGNFIYGNAFQSVQSQAQTHLFAKILSLNTIQFQYQNSSFDQKHMTLKDKNEAFTKQGCGRVVFQKQFNMPYSYTMQCGYTCSNSLNQIVGIDKANRKFDKFSIISDEIENIKSQYYANGKKNLYFTIRAFQNLGKNIAVSILDLFNLNPASRLPNTQYRNIENLRKEIMTYLQHNSNQTNFRKYVLKPFSQQSIKPNTQPSQTSKSKTKTMNSLGSFGPKEQIRSIEIATQKMTVCLTSKQFVFLQTKKAFSEKQTRKGARQDSNRQKLRNPTLPKVNLYRLGNMRNARIGKN